MSASIIRDLFDSLPEAKWIQPTRMTPEELGIAGASDALDGVGGGLPDATKRALHEAMDAMRGKGPFSAESFRDTLSYAVREVLASPLHQNALGGFFQRLAKTGTIRKTGQYVRSQRDGARGRMLALWIAPRGTESDPR